MSLFENAENIRLLQKLLNPQQSQHANNDDSDTDEEQEQQPLLGSNNLNPGSIAAQHTNTIPKVTNGKVEKLEEQIPKSIEEWQEMQEKEDANILDTRKCPTYTMTYRQAVGTEDVFLQMGNRTNASASCEDLILEINLEADVTPADKMNLSITENEVDLSTLIYRLKLPLVHKINVDRSHAKYDLATQKLCLKLRLQRELDFVNF